MARCLATAILFVALLVVAGLRAQPQYAGMPPPQRDVPYLVHADSLVATEVTMATQRVEKNETVYSVSGDKSTVRTPLASPTFVFDAAETDVGKLRLFRLEVSRGYRRISFHSRGRGGAIPLRMETTRVSANLYQLQVVDSLPPGEYGLSPDGTNDVFCFEVF